MRSEASGDALIGLKRALSLPAAAQMVTELSLWTATIDLPSSLTDTWP